MYKTKELFDLTHTMAAQMLEQTTYPWEALDKISDWVMKTGAQLPKDEYDQPSPGVWVAKDAVVYPNTYLGAPCIIGHRTEVRPGAFIRGSVLVGDDAVVGNSTELKNVILFDGVQVPHYNYVGDSILGYKAHMGAGAVTSNVKGDKKTVAVHCDDEIIETGLKKLGAMMGDHTEVGCNTVLNPGTVLGRACRVYPLSSVRGTVSEKHIYKAGRGICKMDE